MWAPLQTAWARMTRLAGLAGLAGSASRALWGEDGEIKMTFLRTERGYQVKTWTSMAPAGVVELCPSSLLPYASSLAMHMHIYPLAC